MLESGETATRRVTLAVSRGESESRRALAPAPPRDGERYELLGELATGGMASVYLGRMRRPMGFARLVAIKCMHPQYAKDPSFASMFLDEARLTARLRHPNIVPTLDIIADGKHLLIVMEYVEGESLAGLLRLVRDANDRVPVGVACAIIHDLLLGLHEAHEARDDDGSALAIIHRDVSPQNVIIGLDGLARVLDFGVAKARSRVHPSNQGEIKGKIPYMPPEQLFGETVDRRVDVYAAGILLWEALVGGRLFEGASEELVVHRIDAGLVDAPSARMSGISPELDALIMRALCRDADGRFPTALAMAEALSAITPLPPRTEISAWMRRFSRPRAVPTAAGGSIVDLAESAGASADAVLAVLERATVSKLAPSADERASGTSRPSLVPVSTTASLRPTPATSRLTMAVGVAAFAIAGVLVGRAMRAENAQAATPRHASITAAAVVAAPPRAVSPDSPSAPAPSADGADPVGATTSAASVMKPSSTALGHTSRGAPKVVAPSIASASTPGDAAPATKGTELAAAPSTSDAKPACRLPYTLDAEGHRHYKVECL